MKTQEEIFKDYVKSGFMKYYSQYDRHVKYVFSRLPSLAVLRIIREKETNILSKISVDRGLSAQVKEEVSKRYKEEFNQLYNSVMKEYNAYKSKK